MLTTERDLRACVELQRATWGSDYDELVPSTVLKVAQKIGGVAAGAFDRDDRMIGFVFGMAGVRGGKIIHWSDMLAVREDARDQGVGQQLKRFQRTAARAAGATTMYWTYDPLVARNAHLNFNRLRVRVDEYVENMYGDSSSELHRGLGTDRLVVAWPLDGEQRAAADPVASLASDESLAPVLNPDGRVPSASALAGNDTGAAVRIEIPLDIVRVRDAAPGDAARWRESTRAAFQWALGSGYGVARFATDTASGLGWYLMTRNSQGTGAG
jgi:predicted GNAT superfamily acetyltransferase